MRFSRALGCKLSHLQSGTISPPAARPPLWSSAAEYVCRVVFAQAHHGACFSSCSEFTPSPSGWDGQPLPLTGRFWAATQL